MICNLCNLEKPIVWNDYAFAVHNSSPPLKAVSINLCYPCLVYLDWQIDIQQIMPKLLTCIQCQEKFIPKNANQIKCSCCWKKYFQAKEKSIVQVKYSYEQQEVLWQR